MKKGIKRLVCTILSFVLLLAGTLSADLSLTSVETKAASYEKAWFPLATMNVNQLAYENASHGSSKHIDCLCPTNAFAPFTGKIMYYSSNYGIMLFQSSNKVYYADGSLDYMTIIFMHGKTTYSTGTTISQGTSFYQLGGLGSKGAVQYGVHLDMGVYRGKISTPTAPYSQMGNVFPYDALFINQNKTTSILNYGKVEPGNSVYNGAPTNYSGLWKTTKDTIIQTGVNVTYQVYDTVSKKWLPNVTNASDYAGIYGHAISAVYANLSKGNITYRVHVKGGSWLSAVTNRSDYAGITSKPIDGLMMTSNTGKTIHYQVHLKSSNRWLPYVTGYSTSDSNNGYAGSFGNEIDGIRAYVG